MLFEAFLCLQFVFVIFWQKEIGAKVVPEMLVNLITGKGFFLSQRSLNCTDRQFSTSRDGMSEICLETLGNP